MAIIANTYKSYESKGNRENLSDVIYNISPEETPLISMIGREEVEGTLFEWQTDALGAVSTGNAQLEGDDYTTFPAVTPTKRVGNYAQISTKLLIVSGTQEKLKKAGRKSEIAYQMSMRGPELRRDIEAITFENIGGDAGGAAVTRKTATLGAWVKTNVDKAGDGANPVYTSGVPAAARTDGTNRAFTVTILKNAIQILWSAGGTPKYLFVGPVNKQRVSGFAGIATTVVNVNASASNTTILAAADVFASDFGKVIVMPSRWQRERDGWLLDPEYVKIREFRGVMVEELAKTGDATKKLMLTEWGLQVKQEAGLALCADLTTT